MGTPPLRAEVMLCACTRGVLTITVFVKTEGRVIYSVESVTPCAACGSRDVEAARLRLTPDAEGQVERVGTC